MRVRMLGSVLATVFSAALALGALGGSSHGVGDDRQAAPPDTGWTSVEAAPITDTGWTRVQAVAETDTGWTIGGKGVAS